MSLAGPLVMLFIMQSPGHSPAACLVASSAAIHGTVRDTTGALIPGATLSLDGVRLQSGADGDFQFLCPSPGAHTLSIQAGGFEPRSIKIPASNDRMLQITLLRIVHPPKLKATNEILPCYDAYRLGRWLAKLVVLAACGYNGKYSNRTRKHQWVGQVEDVPWASS
jgi:hypothetical protein